MRENFLQNSKRRKIFQSLKFFSGSESVNGDSEFKVLRFLRNDVKKKTANREERENLFCEKNGPPP